jgi:hypothetical protein
MSHFAPSVRKLCTLLSDLRTDLNRALQRCNEIEMNNEKPNAAEELRTEVLNLKSNF